jgi:hypothetical protein
MIGPENALTSPPSLRPGFLSPEDELTDFIEKVPIALHWVAEDGTILWANAAELELLGYTREEYVGRNIREFHVDTSVIEDVLQRLINNESLNAFEARLRRKDGSIRDVSVSSSVLRLAGRFIHTRSVTIDVTETKRASELQERMAAIVESSDDAILSKDLNGIIQSWNSGAERIFGYNAKEIVGKHISTLAAPDTVDEFPNILDRIRRGERVDHYQTRRKTKDGRILTVSLTVSPIRNSSGTIIGASKVARDITEHEQQERAIREANAALTRANSDLQQFVYSASHDLQEPLRMVASFSGMLKKKFAGKLGPEADQYIDLTVEGALRMEQLLKDLRSFAQVSIGGEEPAEDVDAGAILEKATENLAALIRESGACITSTPLPSLRIHEFQLEQLFQNLIGNSIRYRSDAPLRIHVAAEQLETESVFSVADNGIGIEPQFKEQIFGMFKRLHSTAEYPGTGMGLAICQRIVDRVGGRIWVESEPGKGSTFFFTIPRRPV